MIKLYRYVFDFDGELDFCPWKRMDENTIYDVKYDSHLMEQYINGDKHITWFMEFKDVKE